ncbi:hypothetical protein [Streptomyces turgidiscabies]|uniref:Uncharacterized protein n=1 Tax=Streptomyces turgidiscabies TaxID=85558 RepID=A0ABU0RRK5_9ACTN|nr:hypothetical protein [Streptomyces turgidiscabies]MDQ0933782.1 hypothetical protein [Streptomyces turgidiscabies]
MDQQNLSVPSCAQVRPARRLIAAGFIRRLSGRTISVRATEAGVTGTIKAARVAELHQLCREDYAKGKAQRATPDLAPTYAAAPLTAHGLATEPSDLDVAIRVAQQLLDSDQILSVREALRLLLRALGAEQVDAPEPLYGGDVDQFIGDAYDSLADSDLDAEAADEDEATTTAPYTPGGPGCGAPATVSFEGYSPRNGLAHGSLDIIVHACDEHAVQARAEWLGTLTPYRTTPGATSRCGESFDFTTLRGGQ